MVRLPRGWGLWWSQQFHFPKLAVRLYRLDIPQQQQDEFTWPEEGENMGRLSTAWEEYGLLTLFLRVKALLWRNWNCGTYFSLHSCMLYNIISAYFSLSIGYNTGSIVNFMSCLGPRQCSSNRGGKLIVLLCELTVRLFARVPYCAQLMRKREREG